jgi:hypothetical protein
MRKLLLAWAGIVGAVSVDFAGLGLLPPIPKPRLTIPQVLTVYDQRMSQAISPATVTSIEWRNASHIRIRHDGTVGSGFAPTARSQSQPDFSGRWILQDPQQAAPDIATRLTISQPLTRTNAFGAPMPPSFLHITVERQFEGATRSESYDIGVISGSVRGGPGGAQRTESSTSVRWEGSRLHFSTEGYLDRSTPDTQRDEVWWLDSSGRLVIQVIERRLNTDAATRTLTYRRE